MRMTRRTLAVALLVSALVGPSFAAAPAAAATYPWHTGIQSTWFYVGEPSGPENDYIPNDMSAWDGQWMLHFGGVDDPDRRTGPPDHFPSAFMPKENPYYVALPYNDFDARGNRRANAVLIPWWGTTSVDRWTSVCKDRWVEVRYGGRSAYAQWEDIGPSVYDDFDYVFGTAAPKNTWGLRAGIDLSPAARDYLGASNKRVDWRFVDASDVPSGPWRKVVTGAPLPPLPAAAAPKLAVARFTNPVAYELRSFLTTRFVIRTDKEDVAVRLVLKTPSGDVVLHDGVVPNAANTNYSLPVWNGLVDGRRLPSSSYDWVLTVTKDGQTTTKTGKITISKVYFKMSGTSAGTTNTHSYYMVPGNANLYIAARTSAVSDSIGIRLSGPGSYYFDAGTFAFGSAAKLDKTVRASGVNAIRARGYHTFRVAGKTAVRYSIIVIQ